MSIFKNVFYAICVSALAVAQNNEGSAQVKQYEFQNDGTGPYRYSFETSNGIKREEEGNLVHPNTDHAAVVVRGSYSYFGPDGVEYKVKYTADENGFHPEGDHFKVPPFVPWLHHHDDQGPQGQGQIAPVTGERILDAYQNPTPTPTPGYSYQPPQPFTTSTRGPYSSRYNNPALGVQQSTLPPSNAYLSTLPPQKLNQPQYSTGERILDAYQQSTPQAYLPSTPSPKPVPYVRENIEKTRELINNNLGNDLQNIYIPSSTPKSVEITVHSIKPLGTEVNHL